MQAFFQKHFRADRGFYLSMLALSLPIAAQNIISLGVNLMDGWLVREDSSPDGANDRANGHANKDDATPSNLVPNNRTMGHTSHNAISIRNPIPNNGSTLHGHPN